MQGARKPSHATVPLTRILFAQFYRLFVVQLEAAEAAVKEAEQIRKVPLRRVHVLAFYKKNLSLHIRGLYCFKFFLLVCQSVVHFEMVFIGPLIHLFYSFGNVLA
jgi:hypothetical protein